MITTDTQIDPKYTAAVRRMVDGFATIRTDWLQAVAKEIDEDECVAMPMWGWCQVVLDPCDERGIRKLMVPLGPPKASASQFPEGDPSALNKWRDEHGLTCNPADYDTEDNFGEMLDEYDIEEYRTALRDAWESSGDEDCDFASCGWEAVGDTGIYAREFDDHLCLGIHGAGYSFFDSHWPRLYDALGYHWHT